MEEGRKERGERREDGRGVFWECIYLAAAR
jgi:hypothetical protein